MPLRLAMAFPVPREAMRETYIVPTIGRNLSASQCAVIRDRSTLHTDIARAAEVVSTRSASGVRDGKAVCEAPATCPMCAVIHKAASDPDCHATIPGHGCALIAPHVRLCPAGNGSRLRAFADALRIQSSRLPP